MIANSQDGPAPGERWDDVRLFLALFRKGSLGAAGESLGLDASTLSRRLATLEAGVGARLFERTREGLVATQAAERLVAAAEDMEAGHLRFAHEASSLERVPEGVVRLSATPGIADDFIVPLLPRLLRRHAGLRIELDASVQVVDLTRREADLALRTIRPQSGDLVMTRALTTRWEAMASPALAKKLGRLGDWSEARWIAWGEDLAAIPPARWLAHHVPKVQPVLRTSAMAAQLAAVEAGLGVALLPDAYRQVRRMVPVAFAPRLAGSAAAFPREETWLVGHRALRQVPRIAAVWDFILEETAAFRTDQSSDS
jgi:DNA-binding transcriptional LysR family regulator